MKSTFKVTPDTNVMIASRSSKRTSPNRELFTRWQNNEFIILFSDDTLREYIKKLNAHQVERKTIEQLITAILELGEHTHIESFHLTQYPDDPDDIAFMLCTVNGQATHLVTYDRHLLDMDRFFYSRFARLWNFCMNFEKNFPLKNR